MPSATDIVVQKALEASSAAFVFDAFESIKKVAGQDPHLLETRPGSAAAVNGYLAGLGPKASIDVKPVSLLLTPTSFFEAAPALASLPPAGARPPVVAYVALSEPLLTNEDNHTQRVPALDRLFAGLASLNHFQPAVLLGGGATNAAQDIVDKLKAAQELAAKGFDVVYAWDAIAAGQEQLASLEASAASAMDVETEGSKLTAAVQAAVGTDGLFTYSGPADAAKVVVLPASIHSSYALAAQASAPSTGLLIAHALQPWLGADLLAKLPATAKEVSVYTESTPYLFRAVIASVRGSKDRSRVRVKALSVPSDALWTVSDWQARLSGGAAAEGSSASKLLPDPSKLAVFWSADEGKAADLSDRVAAGFDPSQGTEARLYKEYDNYSGKDGGLLRSSLLLSPLGDSKSADHPISAIVQATAPHLLFLNNPASVLSYYSPLATIDASTQVVFSASSWAPEEYLEKLSEADRATLASKAGSGNVWTLDVSQVVADSGLIAADGLVEEAAFWHLYLKGAAEAEALTIISGLLAKSPAGGEWSDSAFRRLAELTKAALKAVPFQKAQPAAPAESDAASPEAVKPLPHHIKNNATGQNKRKDFPEPAPVAHKAWHQTAKQLLFQEAYGTEVDAHRPDLPEHNYILTVTENRRLTPLDYDRNVFHLELSTEGTGLTYAVGEALGVHGWNDEAEVREFIEWFGMDPDALVEVPGREHHRTLGEARTVFQTFQQNIDIFGKPGKSFYEALSKVATNREEARHLRFISSAEGSSTFKKWSEADTATYVDVLKAFPSTVETLGLNGLLREIPLIKPRHYSIASSQNFVGDSVHLLVVTVDWMTPKEVQRFGQCTRYLAGLSVGDKVMVSVKPSVMKLPPRDTQPIIMAGLGTGAAPFRAFIQERQWQREQGLDVGPLLYYFGSRYSSKEFLYGEEIKAWLEDGLVTHAGLAFSRDTNKKVYIQHKMKEDSKLISDLLTDGHFYLCGPTWPVPDVHDALCHALVQHQGKSHEEAADWLEQAKETESYVLEVY